MKLLCTHTRLLIYKKRQAARWSLAHPCDAQSTAASSMGSRPSLRKQRQQPLQGRYNRRGPGAPANATDHCRRETSIVASCIRPRSLLTSTTPWYRRRTSATSWRRPSPPAGIRLKGKDSQSAKRCVRPMRCQGQASLLREGQLHRRSRCRTPEHKQNRTA